MITVQVTVRQSREDPQKSGRLWSPKQTDPEAYSALAVSKSSTKYGMYQEKSRDEQV